MKKIYLYNTLGREKQEFIPQSEGHVGMYYCGPTVYWTQHIGNLRGSFCVDIISRSLSYLGYEVNLVRNYTDVGHLSSDQDDGEDKMEKGSKREGLSPLEIAEKYIKVYEQDTCDLNITNPNFKPRATEHIAEMIDMISDLLAKDFAYTTDLAVYFDVSKINNYNKLSGQNLEKNISGAGTGDVKDNKKRNKEDFVLWFFKAGVHSNAIQCWESPFTSSLVQNGLGFPGWHIECSAMSKKYLGKTLDIHMGGIEHVSVHHTNEIAQSESSNEAVFSKYWLHNEHLLVNNGKMSKSEGTSYSLTELKEKGYSPLVLRYFYLQAHYRSKQNFTWDALEASKVGYSRLLENVAWLVEKNEKDGVVIDEYKEMFENALADDFNTPKAMDVAQTLLKADVDNEDKLATILDFDKVLGLGLEKAFENKISAPVLESEEIRPHIELYLKWEKAHKNSDYENSDKLRDELKKMGYEIKSRDGIPFLVSVL